MGVPECEHNCTKITDWLPNNSTKGIPKERKEIKKGISSWVFLPVLVPEATVFPIKMNYRDFLSFLSIEISTVQGMECFELWSHLILY